MISSLYIGLFGGLFGLNMIRVLINSMFASRVQRNKKSIFRFLISSEAVNVMEDINLVKMSE